MQNNIENQEHTLSAHGASDGEKPDLAITCPFLRMVQPRTSNLLLFIRDCHKNKLGLLESVLVSHHIVVKQKGLWAFLRGEAPDLYRLDQIEGISHKDLYLSYLSQVKSKVQALRRNGQISLQDLGDIREWIAAQEGITPNQGSKLETQILFIRAGGDLDSGLIDADDAIRMIEGYEPKKSNVVTRQSIQQAHELVTWSA